MKTNSKFLVTCFTLVALAMWGGDCFAEQGFGRIELIGPGNTVYRAAMIEPDNPSAAAAQIQFVGRSWTGVQYQVVFSARKKDNANCETGFPSNFNKCGTRVSALESIAFDNLATSVVSDDATNKNYYIAARAMTSTGYYDSHLIKFKKDGTQVAAFDSDGDKPTQIGGTAGKGNAFVRGLAYDGTYLVIAGAVGYYAGDSTGVFHPFIARFDATTGAQVGTTQVISGIDGTAVGITYDSNNSAYYIVTTETTGENKFHVHKFTISGGQLVETVTSPWGTAQDLTVSGAGLDAVPSAIAMVNSKIIVVGGERVNNSTPPYRCLVARYNTSDGALDTTFGDVTIAGGTNLKGVSRFTHNTSYDCLLNGIAPPVSGTNFIMVGTAYSGSNYDVLASKVTNTGVLCTAAACGTQFGTNGVSTSTVGTNDDVLNFGAHFGDSSFVYTVGRGTIGSFTGGLALKVNASTGAFVITPAITSVSPIAGPIAGGTTLTLSGSGFVVGNTTAKVDGVTCTSPSVSNATTMTCVTPSRATPGTVSVQVTTNGTETADLVNGYNYLTVPTITSVIENAGPTSGGRSIDIAGTDFVAGLSVTIGGNPCTSPRILSLSLLSCVTPAHTAGAKTVVVTNIDGQSASLGSGYTYYAPPTVTNISPAYGSISGATPITVTGTGFITGQMQVDLGGAVCGSLVFVSSTSLTCTTVAHSAGKVDATANNTVLRVQGTLTDGFEYWNPPTVANVTPRNYGSTAGGTAITVHGKGFQSGLIVKIGGTNCSAYAYITKNQASCTTPAGTAGAKDVLVLNSDGQSGTLTGGFTYVLAPTVSSVNAASGTQLGGVAVTVNGSNFINGATITFGGSACTSVGFTSASVLTCTTPSNSVGLVSVVVTNPDGLSGNANAYTYTSAAPTVTSISPSGGPAAGGTPVTITGKGFITGGLGVTIGTACTGPVAVNATTVTCTTGTGSGVTNVVVTTTYGSGTLTNGYDYQAAPFVSSITPAAGPLAGATPVTIRGANFNGGSTVAIGGVTCTSPSVTTAQITCTTGANSAGSKNVVVTSTGTGTLTNGYVYRAAPTVSSVSPATGAPTGQTPVTITGTGFVTGATATIGGVACNSPVVASATSLTCTTSAHAEGTVTVTVTNPVCLQSGSRDAYTYAYTDTWLSMSTSSGPSARMYHTAVWTTSRMIIWGGYNGGPLSSGAYYNPTTDSWAAVSTTGAPTARYSHTAIWDGTRMIVWGGHEASNVVDTGGEYDFNAGTWKPTGIGSNVPLGRMKHTAVWDSVNSKMIIWGGIGVYPVCILQNTGGVYSPATKQWTATSVGANVPSARYLHSAVFIGSQMLIWGGMGSSQFNTGSKYTAATNTWTAIITTANSGVAGSTAAPQARYGHVAVAALGKMVVFGGYSSSYLNTGGKYDPNSDSWSTTSTTNAPAARYATSAVWTGTRMIVWGGYFSGGYSNTGGSFDPTGSGTGIGTWTAISASGMPKARGEHTAVFGAGYMIIFGGYGDSGSLGTGGRYKP